LNREFAYGKFISKPERETRASGKRLRLVPLLLSMMVLATTGACRVRWALTADGGGAEPIMFDGKTRAASIGTWARTSREAGRSGGL